MRLKLNSSVSTKSRCSGPTNSCLYSLQHFMVSLNTRAVLSVCFISAILTYSFSGSTVSLRGNPASRAIAVAFLTFEVATS